jgi:dolichyldiphosphatase
MVQVKNIILFLLRISPLSIYQFGIVVAIFTRKPMFFVFLLGLIANDVMNFGLKTIIRQPRPSNTGIVDGIKTGCGIIPFYGEETTSFGMPSGHAQCLGYVAAFWTAYLLYERKPYALAYSVVLAAIAVAVGWSRVEMLCHNTNQVFVGLLVGGLAGLGTSLTIPSLDRVFGNNSSGD